MITAHATGSGSTFRPQPTNQTTKHTSHHADSHAQHTPNTHARHHHQNPTQPQTKHQTTQQNPTPTTKPTTTKTKNISTRVRISREEGGEKGERKQEERGKEEGREEERKEKYQHTGSNRGLHTQSENTPLQLSSGPVSITPHKPYPLAALTVGAPASATFRHSVPVHITLMFEGLAVGALCSLGVDNLGRWVAGSRYQHVGSAW